MSRYFGTDGFRGRVGERLTEAHAYAVGRYLGDRHRGGGILVGRDTRRSGRMLERALTRGAMASGATVHLPGVVTTACVSHLVRHGTYAAGVMLSASHNPYYDNGIKLFAADGEKPSDEEIVALEDYLDEALAGRDTLPPGEGRAIQMSAVAGDYVRHLISCGCCASERLRIGLDCGHGSACGVAREVLEALGARVVEIGASPDGVNINDGVGATHPECLAEVVRAQGLDAGFAFDGDADRCIAVDERGRIIDGDGILYLSAVEMQARGLLAQDTVVGTVLSGAGLEAALARRGISLVRTAVGDRYVWAEMKEHGYTLGGERAGHIIYASDEVTGDGIMTALRVTGVMARSARRLSALVEEMQVYPRRECNIPSTSPSALLAAEVVQAAVTAAVKSLAGRGRLLVRPSGTEPLLRVMCEAEETTLCDAAVELITQACMIAHKQISD